ncbi:MAG TPA: hypothetical protein VFO05_00810 [Candidatus Limnocylindrales bacterium]|nr:hypothetical protein [Candidatus Limnocylindrales bacterium]
MTRVIDRGAITAAYVGIGMAATIAVSFLLVIPIEPIYWLLALPAGLLIGYYANQKSDRRAGPWSRILANALFAGAVTALTLAALLLAVKGLFFFADNGYPDFNRVDAETGQPVPPLCDIGAGCVYARYVAAGNGEELASAGVTDPATFTTFYWAQQVSAGLTIVVLTLAGALIGGAAYGLTRPKTNRSQAGTYGQAANG